MSKFLQKALLKLDKVDREQIATLLAQLSQENESLRIVMDSLTDGVLVTDTEGKLSLVNKTADRLVPFRSGDTHQRPIWEAVGDEDLASFFRTALANQEKVVDKEFTFANGRTVTLSFSIYPLVRSGRVEGNVVHVENVTDKKIEQARLRRAESLAALTTLTAGVAHEIKNPLQSIGIHIQLIQKLLQGRKTLKRDQVEPYLQVINEEVGRLNRIVVDFLFTVRPMDAKLVKSDLNQIVRDLIDFMRFELEEANVRAELALGGNLPALELDEKFMKQALLNVIQNAVSAMPEGGTLTVETVRQGNDVHLRITDTGVGIPEEHMTKIWEPFFTTKDFGSGLGLTLVFKIVKEHRGEISVQSRVGEGTTFTVSLPVPKEQRTLLDYRRAAAGGAERDGRA
jgi:two-component system, sporulation sensor kinase E